MFAIDEDRVRSWLATGHPLIFVQRQLGHRSITMEWVRDFGRLLLARTARARREGSRDRNGAVPP